jgi:hypothetical protein
MGKGFEVSRKIFGLKVFFLLVLAFVFAAILFCFPSIPQNMDYHHFADNRLFLGVSNALNVLSNIPFLFVGGFGLIYLYSNRDHYFCFYMLFFGSLLLVAYGSSFYHLHPDNARLFWDRLPMTLAFMSFFSTMIAERISVRIATWALVPLLILGVSSVLYWHYTKMSGQGDLRFYIFVQFFPLIGIPYLLLFFSACYSKAFYIWFALLLYILAKVCELLDFQLYSLMHYYVSGHTIKHLLAALSCYCIYLYVSRRKPVNV